MSVATLTRSKPMVVAEPLLTVDDASRIAEEFIDEHLGNLALAGVPRRMIFPIRAVWAVPILVVYPGYGIAGVIGILAIDDELASIVAATPLKEMRQAAEQLYQEHQRAPHDA